LHRFREIGDCRGRRQFIEVTAPFVIAVLICAYGATEPFDEAIGMNTTAMGTDIDRRASGGVESFDKQRDGTFQPIRRLGSGAF